MTPTQPQVIETVPALRQAVAEFRRQGKTIGLVPTMGALHAGHLSLVQASKAECDVTVVTIYVNPSQFGPSEDLAQYPRTLQKDLDALADHGVEIAFVPRDDQVYKTAHATWIEVGAVAEPLEGAARPGHFRGVATVVLKLFNMAAADVAFFGQKDYQQALVIRRMVEDLDVPIEIRVCPIVRESDGLAMSSRNVYLDAAARRQSLVLFKSLALAQELIDEGIRRPDQIVDRMHELIESAQDARIEYVALVDPETLQAVATIDGPTLAVLAVRIGPTRLIDNRLLDVPSRE